MQYFQNFELKQNTNLELLANQVVEGFIIGLHKSPFHGFSVEFAEHRLYMPGESTKNIDWKVYARTDRLYSKKYEEETNLRCQIVIDVSSSMHYPEPNATENNLNKLQFSSLAAASLMNLLKKQRDSFGLSLFDEEVKVHTPTKISTTHYRLMLSHLDAVIHSEEKNKKTAAADALHQIADSIHKRSLVIVFSDMLEGYKDNEILFSALQHLKHNKHEVILFHVMDKTSEIDFKFKNRPYLFIDMESGDRVKLQPQQVEKLYREQIKDLIADIRLKCMQYKIDFIEADINEGFNKILQSYLVKRNKMKI